MRFLRADPQYIALCGQQKCYRARLTPKPWRDTEGFGRACCAAGHYSGMAGWQPSPLIEQILLHDEMTGVIEYPVYIEERYLA
jgi:hypothetical protein